MIVGENLMKGTIFSIQRNSIVDGPGIRTTVFFKGCNLKCKWCHNPESQNLKKEILFYKNKCNGCGRCRDLTPEAENFICFNGAKEICGKDYTPQELLTEIIKDKVFYDASTGGVTFSGGECMLQIDFLKEILEKCKECGIHTAVDTAGKLPWKYFEQIIPYTDLFLYDIKAVSENLHIEGTHFSNKVILSNLKRLSDNYDGEIIIRVPIIPNFNAKPEEIKKIANFLSGVKYKSIELLSYHRMSEHKYEALNMPFTNYQLPRKEDIEAYKKILK